jgi:phospholipid/cholesterol/gamma-HCH transport system substrate-binding protein
MKNEAKVGFFVFAAMIFLFFLTSQVNSFKNFSSKGYTIYTKLDDASGLEKNSKVKANGIDIGFVKDLEIDKDKVKAKIFIKEGVKIPNDSVVVPVQESLLGGKYVGIKLGKSNEYLKDKGVIKSGVPLATINEASDSMTKAADEFKDFIKDIRDVMDEDTKHNLKETFANINKITSDLKEFTKEGKLDEAIENFNQMAKSISKTSQKFESTANTLNSKLPQIISNLDLLIKNLKVTSQSIKEKLPNLADKYAAIADELQNLLHQNSKPINNSINEAKNFFSKGKDAFEKVDTILGAVDRVQLEVAMHGEAMSKDDYTKGYMTLNYQPSSTKSYIFELSGMDDYSNMDENRRLIPPQKHDKNKLLVSAQIAKTLDDVTLRGGLIENTFGAGIDYYMLNKQLKTSAELYDMNAQNDVRGEKAHAKISARYTILKHLDIYAGYDNFLNSSTKNAFVGLGVRFYDDDLKTLIISQGLGAFTKK